MLYHCRVKSKDAAGNLAVSGDFTFTTAQNGSAAIKWLVTDHLGSTRMVIDETGSLAGITRHDFLPFGEELSAGVGIRSENIGYSVDSVRQKFDAYERDNETGLDFAQARYYSNIQGRFTSVDPENAGAKLGDPQSWNGYAFSRNNPVVFGDPTGTDYKFCVNGECSYHTDPNVNEWLMKGDFSLSKGKVLDKDGNQIGTYQYIDTSHGLFSGREMGQFYTEALPAVGMATKQAVAIVAAPYVVGAGIATGGAALGVGGIGFGTTVTTLGLSGAGASGGVIAGLYGATSVATLESLASSGGPTVEVVTNLTQSPVAGRALSTAIGNGAEALANQAGAIRGAGQLFRAQIPRALLEELKRVGLAREITTRMGGVTGTEVRFAPQITRFIVNFFK
jgi:RHS repeat-associated protein